MAQGFDFDQMLPYLSKFLGHKSFNETYYYYHYAEEAAKTIHSMDKTACRVIPEVNMTDGTPWSRKGFWSLMVR